MSSNIPHISSYKSLTVILIILLSCTFLTIEVATHDFGKLALTIALLIAGVKSYFVMTYFMHLKHESLLLRLLVIFVFVLFALLVGITLIDYGFRP